MAVNRRTFLVAGAVGAVSATAGLSLWKQREIAASTPSGATPPATASTPHEASVVTQGTFNSAARNGTDTNWFIIRPPGHPEPLPTVIALHMYGGTAASAIELGAPDVLAQAVANGSPPIAIASVDGGKSSFWHRRASGEDPEAMVFNEFIPLLQSQGLDTSRVGFLGWSMGGYGALLLGARLGAPRAAAICAVSPALWPQGDYLEDAFDSEQDYANNTVWGLAALNDIPIRIDCGTEDSLYPASRQFAEQLARLPAGGFTPGGHDPAYWKAQLPSQIAWLAGYVGTAAPTPTQNQPELPWSR